MTKKKEDMQLDADLEYFGLMSKLQRSNAANFDYAEATPEWLLEGKIGSVVWVTSGATPEAKTVSIYFNHRLPDGASLTDAAYSQVLLSIQRIAIALRMGHLGISIDPIAWATVIAWLKNLASWMVLRSDTYDLKTNGFMSLDQAAIITIMTELCTGGWAEALNHTDRFIDYMHRWIYGQSPPAEYLENPFDLPEDFISADYSRNKIFW